LIQVKSIIRKFNIESVH